MMPPLLNKTTVGLRGSARTSKTEKPDHRLLWTLRQRTLALRKLETGKDRDITKTAFGIPRGLGSFGLRDQTKLHHKPRIGMTPAQHDTNYGKMSRRPPVQSSPPHDRQFAAELVQNGLCSSVLQTL